MLYKNSIGGDYLKSFSLGAILGTLHSLYKVYSRSQPSDLLEYIKACSYHKDGFCEVYRNLVTENNECSLIARDALYESLKGGIFSSIGSFIHNNLTDNPVFLNAAGCISSLQLIERVTGRKAQSSDVAFGMLATLGGAYISHTNSNNSYELDSFSTPFEDDHFEDFKENNGHIVT